MPVKVTEHDISRHLSHEHQILQEIDQNLSAEHPDIIFDELREARQQTEQRIADLALMKTMTQLHTPEYHLGLDIPPIGEPLDAPHAPSFLALDIDDHPRLFNERTVYE